VEEEDEEEEEEEEVPNKEAPPEKEASQEGDEEEEKREEKEDEGSEEESEEEKNSRDVKKERDAIFKIVQKNMFRWKASQKLEENSAGSLLKLPIWFTQVCFWFGFLLILVKSETQRGYCVCPLSCFCGYGNRNGR